MPGCLRFLGLFGLVSLGSGSAEAAVLVRSTAVGGDVPRQALREVTDPCLGVHWRLVVDPSHPSWPARMILLDRNAKEAKKSEAGKRVAADEVLVRVIHAGDQVTVDQDSGIVRARLHAVALEPAAVGQPLKVRLIINNDLQFGFNSVLASRGPVISVIATGSRMTEWGSPAQTAAATESERNKR